MRIDVDSHNTVSAILHVPDGATSLYVMAHGQAQA